MTEVVAQATGELVLAVDKQEEARGLQTRRDEHGMVSAEWAVGLIAAIAVAGVLLAVVTNGQVQEALLHFILKVINAFSGKLVNR